MSRSIQLKTKEKLYTQFREVPNPEEIFEKAPSAKDFPEDNSIMLLDETHKIVHQDGATEEKRYEMIKVFNTTGVDTWKEYSIGVYAADGSADDLNVADEYYYDDDANDYEAVISYAVAPTGGGGGEKP